MSSETLETESQPTDSVDIKRPSEFLKSLKELSWQGLWEK